MYVKNDHKGFSFPNSYKQVFKNKWNANAVNDREIIRLYSDGILQRSDLKICLFLFEHVFATAEMLMQVAGAEDAAVFEKGLAKLVQSRLLNMFSIADEPVKGIAPDAYLVYCLDIGGKHLLSNYSKEFTVNWNTSSNCKCPENITRDLVTSQFSLMITNAFPTSVKEFRKRPLRIGKEVAEPSFELHFDDKGTKKFFLGEVVREFDMQVSFRDRVEKLNSIVSTNIWKRYFIDTDKAPVVFFLTENDDNALEVARMATAFGISTFRLTTDARIATGLGAAGAWLKYDPESMLLKQTRIGMFAKEK